MKVTKAIITASGWGTRFLPASSAYQKEMVPVMHKPQIHWVIEEAIESGISDIALVVREGSEIVKRYLIYTAMVLRLFLPESLLKVSRLSECGAMTSSYGQIPQNQP